MSRSVSFQPGNVSIFTGNVPQDIVTAKTSRQLEMLFFQEVMERHNRCWRLTDLYDKVFRNVLGCTFLFCVPIFCMVTTQVVKIYTERRGDEQLISRILYMMLWSVSCIAFTSLVCGFASSINTAVCFRLLGFDGHSSNEKIEKYVEAALCTKCRPVPILNRPQLLGNTS